MKKLIALALTLCLVMTGCLALAEPTEKADYDAKIDKLANSMLAYYEASGETAKIAPYEEPLTVHMVSRYNAGMQDAMSVFEKKYGESWDANRYTDLYKKLYNIDVKFDWWTAEDQYDQKLRMDMASGELPDIFFVTSQVDLLQLVENDLIWDLTDLYEQWASNMDRSNWEADNAITLKTCTFDGRLYALPASLPDTDLFSYFWIRRDWLNKLNLPVPTTLAELKDTMAAFMAADFDGNGVADTIGMGMDKDLYYPTRGIFSAYGGYPEFWTDVDGKLVWGGTTEGTKNALTFLADLYKEGYLDPEFITKTETDMLEAPKSGKCGVMYGGHWLGQQWGDVRAVDPEADWVSFRLPVANEGDDIVKQYLQPYCYSWTVVNKNCKNPEAAFKMFAASDFAFYGEDSGWWIYDENVGFMFSPVHVNCSGMENLNAWLAIQEVFKTGDTSKLHFNGLAYWEKINGEYGYEWKLMFGDATAQDGIAMSVLKEAYDNGRVIYEPYQGVPSTYMQDHWSTIKDEQLIAFTKIIIGEVPVEEGFNAWLASFSSMGGDRVTEEVNEWYAAQKTAE